MNVAFLIKHYSTEDGVNNVTAMSEVYRTMESAGVRMQELNESSDNLNEDGTQKHVYFVSIVKYND